MLLLRLLLSAVIMLLLAWLTSIACAAAADSLHCGVS
jgi:hypothetical protein